MFYLVLKSLHIVFVASWFAGLFYLPRIFVNMAQETDANTQARLLQMAQRLLKFMTILAIPALGFGIGLAWSWVSAGRAGSIFPLWLWLKLAVVILAIGYHHACGSLLKKFQAGKNTRSHKWYRWFNEVPVLLMLVATLLVVIKPN